MSEPPIWLTPSDIKQYFYCPRIVYFIHVLGYREPPAPYEDEGKEAHEELTRLERRRKTLLRKLPLPNAEKRFLIELADRKHHLRGRLDCLIITPDGEHIPVEYKHARSLRRRPHPHHKYQLVAYALLVEQAYNTIVRRAYLYYEIDDTLIHLPITTSMKHHVLKALQHIRRIIQTEEFPDTRQPPSKCRACGYRRLCNPHP